MTIVDKAPRGAEERSQMHQRRQAFYDRAGATNLAPLWEVLHGLVPAEPQTPAVPALWSYDKVRPYLLEACDVIGTEEAERRVLVLENPGLKGRSRITRSIYAGLQIVLPGEIARAHRHAAAALRFVIESDNAYTAVQGEKSVMEPGDFVVTPSWHWHDHGNEGEKPVIWLDGLDLHIVNLMDCSFWEVHPDAVPERTRPEGSAIREAGLNLLPMDYEIGKKTSPIFNYPYRRTREALDGMVRLHAPDSHLAYRMRFINPVNGDWAIPTIATWMQLLPKGFTTEPYRSTDGVAHVVAEGRGYSIIGANRFDWQRNDIFVVPSWCPTTHVALEESVLFGMSDRVVQEKLGLWRERREGAAA